MIATADVTCSYAPVRAFTDDNDARRLRILRIAVRGGCVRGVI
jgi:hypothetical protein